MIDGRQAESKFHEYNLQHSRVDLI